MYLRLDTVEDKAEREAAARFRDIWQDNDFTSLPPPVRSLPIKVWALLHEGAFTVTQIAELLACAPRSVYVCIQRLRDAGQHITNERRGRGPGRFRLEPGPPLQVILDRDGIRLPHGGSRRSRNEVIIELK